MNKYICDDRMDIEEIANRIRNMTDEEFEIYLEEVKKEEVD